MTTRRRQRGSAAQRVLSLVEAVAAAEQAPTSADLIASLGLPKPTVHRLCSLLEREGFVQRRLGGRRLVPGPRLLGLARAVLASAGLRAEQHAILQRLSREIGETCNISIPDGSQMIYFDRVETQWPLRLQLPIGSRVPVYCTASGKLCLANLPAATRKRVIANLRLERHTPNTLTDPAKLEAGLKRIRADQTGTDDEEFLEGMIAVSVPVTDRRGRLFATLSTHAPAMRMTLAQARTHVPRLRHAAAQLSALLDE